MEDEDRDEDSMPGGTETGSFLSPLASPIASPPSETYLRQRRRSSLIPPEGQMINLSPSRYVCHQFSYFDDALMMSHAILELQVWNSVSSTRIDSILTGR